MASATHMSYGSFQFDPQPIPFINISKEYLKTQGGINFGATISVTLEGTVAKVTGDLGIINVDQEIDRIRSGFNRDGLLFTVDCDNNVFLSGFPRINSLEFSPSADNWVQTAPYTIELEFDETQPWEDSGLLPPYLQDVDENWSVEFFDERYPFSWTLPNGSGDSCPLVLRLSHELTAQGKSTYNEGGLIKEAWEWAKFYVTGNLGFDERFLAQSGVFNISPQSFSALNHMRSATANETVGTFSATESWLVIDTGVPNFAGNALEDFSIEVRKGIDNGLTSATIQGEIQGLATVNLTATPLSVTQSKYAAASGYWGTIKNRLLQRVKLVGDDTAVRNFHILPVNESVGHNACNGTISYTYEYNDRPIECIAGALSERITISDTAKTDVFASLIILGKSSGPILQDIGTRTARTRTLSIDVIVQPATGCTFSNWENSQPDVTSLVNSVEADLNSNSQVFKTQDDQTWEANIGHFTKTVSWTYGSC